MGEEYPIDEWKRRLGHESDETLAKDIGVERSTISVWRKKGVPAYISKLFTLLEEQHEKARPIRRH